LQTSTEPQSAVRFNMLTPGTVPRLSYDCLAQSNAQTAQYFC
jgi:hypothetical protein